MKQKRFMQKIWKPGLLQYIRTIVRDHILSPVGWGYYKPISLSLMSMSLLLFGQRVGAILFLQVLFGGIALGVFAENAKQSVATLIHISKERKNTSPQTKCHSTHLTMKRFLQKEYLHLIHLIGNTLATFCLVFLAIMYSIRYTTYNTFLFTLLIAIASIILGSEIGRSASTHED